MVPVARARRAAKTVRPTEYNCGIRVLPRLARQCLRGSVNSVARGDMAQRTCSIIGCGGKHYAKTWCRRHYKSNLDHGDPLHVPVQRTPVERFHEKYNVEASGCWMWFGPTRSGYGEFSIGKRKVRAHRFAYETFRGAIPAGLVIDHLCRQPRCVNPGHLQPVTRGENVLRGEGPTAALARRLRCRNGHEFTPENTSVNDRGHRGCRTCWREQARASYHRRKSVTPAA